MLLLQDIVEGANLKLLREHSYIMEYFNSFQAMLSVNFQFHTLGYMCHINKNMYLKIKFKKLVKNYLNPSSPKLRFMAL